MMERDQPLKGLKVLEMGTLIAGPFCARIMAEFGAEVIKIERPGSGDPLRSWRYLYQDTSLWWLVQSRNKKCITLDLQKPKARDLILSMVEKVDIVVENFRPGTLERWGIGYDDLKEVNPSLIMVRISGFGQTGPYKEKPGFGAIGESMGGIRYITGYPDRPPTRVGISIGDSLAAMYGVIGALMAVYHRDSKGTREGQFIDVSLYESVFSLMESMLPEYDLFQVVRERTGSILPGIVPSNTYTCRDGKFLVIGGNSDSIFKRLMLAIGQKDMAESEEYRTNKDRAKHSDLIDGVIKDWALSVSLEEGKSILDDHQVPCGSIYSIADIVEDEHYKEREMILDFPLEGNDTIKVPGIVPKMSSTPGEIRWLGPEIGAHNQEIYGDLLGLSENAIKNLKEEGVL